MRPARSRPHAEDHEHDAKLTIFVLYRRLQIDHDVRCEFSATCSHHRRMDLLRDGPVTYSHAQRSFAGAFAKGQAAFRAGEKRFDNPYEGRTSYYRGSGNRRGGWRQSAQAFAWHWEAGWAWAEAHESDEAVLRVLAGRALDLFDTYLWWMDEVHRSLQARAAEVLTTTRTEPYGLEPDAH